MSSDNYQTPDLATVLRTLASFAPPNPRPQSQQSQLPQLPSTTFQAPLQNIPNAQPVPLQSWPQTAVTHPVSSTPPPKIIDPTTITDWSSGLRCVMKTVAKHDSMLQDIRRMIKVQNEHEEQWWRSREALVERQKAREEGQKKLDNVLKLVGGSTMPGASANSPEEMAKELETFDMKVHRAQTQMVQEMSTRLKNYGVPFFGTRPELIRVTGRVKVQVERNDVEKAVIDEKELFKLQRRILGILEDLCSD